MVTTPKAIASLTNYPLCTIINAKVHTPDEGHGREAALPPAEGAKLSGKHTEARRTSGETRESAEGAEGSSP